MTLVKFDKSVKYNGVRYSAHEAFKVDNADVDALHTAGATILSVEEDAADEVVDDTQEEGEDVSKLKEKLLSYSVMELTAFAEERGIDLQKKTRKAEIYNIIVASL